MSKNNAVKHHLLIKSDYFLKNLLLEVDLKKKILNQRKKNEQSNNVTSLRRRETYVKEDDI